MPRLYPIFDLDGTLIDSDAALIGAFVSLGIEAESVTFGHVLAAECARLGIRVDDYLEAYDPDLAKPYAGVDELLARLDGWSLCSNKEPRAAAQELERLGWHPEVARFVDSFPEGKELRPVLEALAVAPDDVVYIGDTSHDRRCAEEAGVAFVLAGWNERAREIARAGDVVLDHPVELLDVLSPG